MATRPRERTPQRKRSADPQLMWRVFLGERGLSASKARDAVVTTFLESKDHVDLQALYARAKRRQPGVGFATVYRTMKLLEEAGIAHARRFGNTKETLYEIAVGRAHHDHLICEQCSEIVEFVDDEVEELQDKIAARYGFSLSGHRHELYGICARCRESRKSS